jgi:hypothetical protein
MLREDRRGGACSGRTGERGFSHLRWRSCCSRSEVCITAACRLPEMWSETMVTHSPVIMASPSTACGAIDTPTVMTV